MVNSSTYVPLSKVRTETDVNSTLNKVHKMVPHGPKIVEAITKTEWQLFLKHEIHFQNVLLRKKSQRQMYTVTRPVLKCKKNMPTWQTLPSQTSIDCHVASEATTSKHSFSQVYEERSEMSLPFCRDRSAATVRTATQITSPPVIPHYVTAL